MSHSKDATQKVLLACKDIFADVINVFIFSGDEKVKAEDLEPFETPVSIYTAEKGDIHSQERDLGMYWKDGNIGLQIAEFGIENQTEPDPKMPLRIISYDGARYRNQLNTRKDNYYPIITLVLYYGTKEWPSETCYLHNILNINDDLKPYVSDYKINVFDINKLTEEQLDKFKTEVANYFGFVISKNNKTKYTPINRTIKHGEELMNAITAYAGDNFISEAYNKVQSVNKGGNISMCDVVQRIQDKGEKIGIEKGVQKVIIKMINEDAPNEQIIKFTGASESLINKLKDELANSKNN